MLLLFLGDVRAAFIVTAVIPLPILVGFIGMQVVGVSANLMSLRAIDFGMIVDGDVVMMENCICRLKSAKTYPREEVRQAANVVIGGLVSATGPTLFLLPLIYPWFSPNES